VILLLTESIPVNAEEESAGPLQEPVAELKYREYLRKDKNPA
jgi:hypothetical protein